MSPEDLRVIVDSLPDCSRNRFDLHPVTFHEVLAQLRSLRSHTSTGADQIPVKYLKLVADHIASPLTDIINGYLSNHSFPALWKLARVTPIPKIDQPTDVDDYRPITILPALSKVYERLILHQVLEFINLNEVLNGTVSGFRKGHSTTTTLLRIRDDILGAMKKGEVTLIAFADFSKAFRHRRLSNSTEETTRN